MWSRSDSMMIGRLNASMLLHLKCQILEVIFYIKYEYCSLREIYVVIGNMMGKARFCIS